MEENAELLTEDKHDEKYSGIRYAVVQGETSGYWWRYGEGLHGDEAIIIEREFI